MEYLKQSNYWEVARLLLLFGKKNFETVNNPLKCHEKVRFRFEADEPVSFFVHLLSLLSNFNSGLSFTLIIAIYHTKSIETSCWWMLTTNIHKLRWRRKERNSNSKCGKPFSSLDFLFLNPCSKFFSKKFFLSYSCVYCDNILNAILPYLFIVVQ